MAEEHAPIESLLSCRVRPRPTALIRTLPDGSSVVLDLESETYFGLDSVGADMWGALTDQPTVAAARSHLMTMYDVEEARLNTDMAEFIGALRSRGLVDVVEND